MRTIKYSCMKIKSILTIMQIKVAVAQPATRHHHVSKNPLMRRAITTYLTWAFNRYASICVQACINIYIYIFWKEHLYVPRILEIPLWEWTSHPIYGPYKFFSEVLVAQSCPTLCDPMNSRPQAPLSMRFSRQEYWNGLPCPPPGDLPDPGNELSSLTSPALAGRFFTTSTTWEARKFLVTYIDF